MDRDFLVLAAILTILGLAGVCTGLTSHPIMYFDSVAILLLGLFHLANP